jgi:DNA-binding protein H-NS
MTRSELESMSMHELGKLHERVDTALSRKMVAEMATIEERLHRLSSVERRPKLKKRSYPKVAPKYRNPKNRTETWAGIGKQPRWLVAQLQFGKKLEDFQIDESA